MPNPIYNGQDPTDNVGISLEMVWIFPGSACRAVGPELYRDNYTITGPNAFVFNEPAGC